MSTNETATSYLVECLRTPDAEWCAVDFGLNASAARRFAEQLADTHTYVVVTLTQPGQQVHARLDHTCTAPREIR